MKLATTLCAAVLAMACAAVFAQAPPSSAPVAAVQAAPQGPQPSMLPFGIQVAGYGMLKPKADITPEESMWLAVMLAVGVDWHPNAVYFPDFPSFVKLHHLERHFEPLPASVPEKK